MGDMTGPYAVHIKIRLRPISFGHEDLAANLNFTRVGDDWVCRMSDEMMRDMMDLYPQVAVPNPDEKPWSWIWRI